MRAREKGEKIKTRIVGRIEKADFVLKVKRNPNDRWRMVEVDESKLQDFDFNIDKRQGRGSPQRPSSPSPLTIVGPIKSSGRESEGGEVSGSNESGRLDLLMKNDQIKVSKK